MSVPSFATILHPPLGKVLSEARPRKTVLSVFGTRPEVIKLAPLLLEFQRNAEQIRSLNVSSGQHAHLLKPLIDLFGVRVDLDLSLMTANQSAGALRLRIINELDAIIRRERPDLIVVQGDTTTALAGAIAGCRRGIPVAHLEAGLRSGDLFAPFPEEINRQRITRLATYHFAPTGNNRQHLLKEGIAKHAIFVTGNTVVDALQMALSTGSSPRLSDIRARIGSHKYIVFTSHRRESFGPTLKAYLSAMRTFVERHADVAVVFPIHPNPNVERAAQESLNGDPRIILTTPLSYADFIHLLSESWLIVSDSGGIQEEVASVGKPLLILRKNTERPECIEAGVARLVGSPESLLDMLEEAEKPSSWVRSVKKTLNPFGSGDSAQLICNFISSLRLQ